MRTENLYTANCIRTYSGQYVNVFDPDPATITLQDIAHSLSQQCRFGGHLPHFYSVAQHSIQVMRNVAPEHKIAALLHDASEAYLLDIPSPVKPHLTNYKEIEDRIMRVIAEKFDFQWPLSQEVKDADKEQLEYEWEEMMILRVPHVVRMTGAQARYTFRNHFDYLQAKRQIGHAS